MTDRRPDRLGMNSLLLIAALSLAPLVPRLPAWIVLVCAGCLLWRFAVENRAWPGPGRVLRLGLTLVVVAAVLEYYGTLLGRDAGSALLASLLALKFLEVRKLRDCMVALFLCYLLLLAIFLYSQSPAIALYSAVVVVLSMATLVRLNHSTGTDLRYALGLASTLSLKAVPLMLIMFMLFPRIPGTLWGFPGERDGDVTGMSEVMEPGSVRHLSRSYAPVFRVEFDGPVPARSQMYWRALVLWWTDGRRWERGVTSSALDPGLSFDRQGAPIKYTVTLEPSRKPWLPALDLPIVAPRGTRTRPGYLLEHRRVSRERQRYTLVSYTRYRTDALDRVERELALQLPAQLSLRVRALARALRRESTDDLGVARAAMDYFRQQPFFYTLEPPLLGDDPVDEFLFSTRRGFCGYFAAAFVTLMRVAGIPSRIVQGYLGGEYNPAGDYWIVRQADAHAWAEVWLPSRGWVRMDPTAAVAPERVELGIDAVRELTLRGFELGQLSSDAVRRLIELGWFAGAWRTMRLYWDLANLQWHRSVLGYDQQRQRHLLRLLRLPELSWRGLLLTLALVLAAAMLLLAVTTRRARRADPVQASYRAFCRKLGRAGIQRHPAEGALAFAARTVAARPDLKASVDSITALYLRIRYGGLSGIAPVQRLRQQVARFSAARAKQCA